MKPAAFIPREYVQAKPPHGAPCTSCGVCCMVTICPIGQRVFGRFAGPCPALERNGEGKSSCGLVRLANEGGPEYGEAAAHLIGAGTGCDCRINGEPINHAFHAMLRERDRLLADKTRAAVALFFSPNAK